MAGRRRNGQAPQICHHKASGRAYATVDGRQIYLGVWNSPEARRAYREFVGRWEQSHRPEAPNIPAGECRVSDLVSAFMLYAKDRYVRADGSQTSEYSSMRGTLASLLTSHGDRRADDVRGRDIIELVQSWKASGVARKTINQRLGRIKTVFKWGANPARELIATETAYRIGLVDGLAIGEGPEYDEVTPVPLRDLVATLRHVKPHIRAMIRFQYYAGARPGEVCRMRGDEIFRGSFRQGGRTIRIPDGCDVFVPTQHKTRRKGQEIHYTLGPRAQAAISPYLIGDGPLFVTRLKKPMHQETYANNITIAAAKAGVAHWSPNQLRHNFLTRWDQLASLEDASAAVRHKRTTTTATYVQRDLTRTAALAARLG